MPKKFKPKNKNSSRHLTIVPKFFNKDSTYKHLPGTFVHLENQPKDMPPFEVLTCRGQRCFVRQQSWGNFIHWEVESYRLKAA
tara:strand:+ start:31046 stop:31294 length:249 start_codon:yes stop_codon:yes gene_type:complete